MRRHDIVVRRLDAIETLAAVRVICFDKTGTLSLNRMSVAAVACGAGERSRRQDENLTWLLRIGVLCSETEIGSRADGSLALDGSATENALVQEAIDAGLDVAALRREYPRLSIRHRRRKVPPHGHNSSRSRRQGTADRRQRQPRGGAGNDEPGGFRTGSSATSRLIPARRSSGQTPGWPRKRCARTGFAFRQGDWRGTEDEDALAVDLTWVGLAGLADPVRPGIQALMGTLHRAGIHSLVMTRRSGTNRTRGRAAAEAERRGGHRGPGRRGARSHDTRRARRSSTARACPRSGQPSSEAADHRSATARQRGRRHDRRWDQ